MSERNMDNLGEQLSAYLDGELSEADRLAVEALIREDASAAAELERLRVITKALGELPRGSAPEDLSAHVMSSIGESQSTDKTRGSSRRRLLQRPIALSAAAVVTIGVGVGIWALLLSEPRQGYQRVTGVMKREADEPKMAKRITPSEPVAESAVASLDDALEVQSRPLATRNSTDGDAPVRFRRSDTSVAAEAQSGAEPSFAQDVPSTPTIAHVVVTVTCADEADIRRCVRRLEQFTASRGAAPLDPVEMMDRFFRVGDETDRIRIHPLKTNMRQVQTSAGQLRNMLTFYDASATTPREVTLALGSAFAPAGEIRETSNSTRLAESEATEAARDTASGRSERRGRSSDALAPVRSILGPGRNKFADSDKSGSIAEANARAFLEQIPDDHPVSVTFRFGTASSAEKPEGEPGRLVPELSEDQQRP